MNVQKLDRLRQAYLITFRDFAVTISEVAEEINEDGSLGSPDQARRAATRLMKELEARGLCCSTDVNDEAQGSLRRGAYKELAWQCWETYDSLTDEEAVEKFEAAYADELAAAKRKPTPKKSERASGEIDPAHVIVGDVIKLPGVKARARVLSVKREDETFAITYLALGKNGEARPTELITFHPIGKPITLITPTNQKEATMATVTRKTKTGAKADKPAAKKATAKKATAETTRRTAEDVRALVPQFVEHLTNGGSMKALKEEHGFSDDGPIRAALYFEGFDSKGNEHGVEAESIDAGKAAGRKAVAKLRSEGAAWYALAFMTGLSQGEVKKIVADAGVETSGRVYKAAEPKAKAVKAAKTEAKAEVAAKTTGGKKLTKGTAKAGAAKKTRKAVAADPS